MFFRFAQFIFTAILLCLSAQAFAMGDEKPCAAMSAMAQPAHETPSARDMESDSSLHHVAGAKSHKESGCCQAECVCIDGSCFASPVLPAAVHSLNTPATGARQGYPVKADISPVPALPFRPPIFA